MKSLAVIPARAGSRGVPGKNIVDFHGKPLIAWTIEAASMSRCFARVIVSTDSEEIAEVARHWGAEVPFIRPAQLATDFADPTSVVVHALRWMQKNGDFHPTHVALLQPTSPFRNADHIRESMKLIKKRKSTALVSVTLAREHPFWMKKILKSGKLTKLFPEKRPGRRQDMPVFYVLNGAIYIATAELLLGGGDWHTNEATAYVMTHETSIDIDSPVDLMIARCLAGALK